MLFAFVPALMFRKQRPAALIGLATLAATGGAVSLIKALTGRVRPCSAIGWCHTLAIDVPMDPSFPSGHAAGSFAFATFFSCLDRRAAWVLFPAAFLVAASRIVLGVHYPSDVIVGALLGSTIGWLGSQAYRSRAPDCRPEPETPR
jgi:undecaprenyl-diphosphatase